MSTISLLDMNLPKKPADRQYWADLHGLAASFAIFSAGLKHTNLTVVITADMQKAIKLHDELEFFAKENSSLPIFIFPDWEILPYDQFSPHQDIISARLLTLYKLPQLSTGILIIPINTLMHYTTTPHYVESLTFILQKGDILDLIEFQRRLESRGYRHVSQVMEHGEFSVKGSLIDLYPMGSINPYRIDLFDNEVDSIRLFEPDSQRSLETVNEIKLLPAREFPLDEQAISQFRQAWRQKFSGNPALCSIYENISKGHSATGIEYYLPLFFQQPSSLFDFIPSGSLIIQVGDIEQKAAHFWQEVSDRYEQLRYDIQRPILEPKDIVLPVNDVFGNMKKFAQVVITEQTQERARAIHFNTSPIPQLRVHSKAEEPLKAIKEYIATTSNRLLFCAETLGRRESLLNLFEQQHIQPTSVSSWNEFVNKNASLALTVAGLDDGMCLNDLGITVITEAHLFGQQVMQRRLRSKPTLDPQNIIKDLVELKIGSPVVHIHHGVGKYIGLQIIKTGEYEAEYLTLEYADGDKLYVPISALHLIARYTGREDDKAPIYQLGSKRWEKIKRKTAEKIRDVAAELLAIYAQREAKSGFAFSIPDEEYETFAEEFPFEETPDQLKVINEVLHDMTLPRPMDRLVCGDVGFGKTEVAMRAAFIATQNLKQVAVLVPTTLLAQQHFQNFNDRFANWPIKIASFSRFQTKKEQDLILTQLAEGKVDIIIGTHKLLQQQVKFPSLGLLIIDEEHRFGVGQKEKIKALKTNVDIMTLTATPIPRTLNMALTGVRDLSIIATPPARRLAVKTFVREYNPAIIKEAVLREVLRGGQVYFLHNDVSTIQLICDELAKLVPEAKINFAHGQMSERYLEKVMADFYHSRFNLLVCTTIIESGIDVPSANTIIINKADRLGLAQLHQLRGRVGRSHHQAYAYLLTPSFKVITKDAQKRLEAIESLEDLGAGFMLATHDLEIRGSGEILGEDQSGFIEEVGFHLYSEMLEQAVNALKDGKELSLDTPIKDSTDIDLKISALIPEGYMKDVQLRLTFYKRISSAKSQSALHDIQVELIDRFGLFPQEIKNLFIVAEMRLTAESLGVNKIELGEKRGKIEFSADPNINLPALLNLIQKQPRMYQLEGSKALKFAVIGTNASAKLKTVEQLLAVLTPK